MGKLLLALLSFAYSLNIYAFVKDGHIYELKVPSELKVEKVLFLQRDFRKIYSQKEVDIFWIPVEVDTLAGVYLVQFFSAEGNRIDNYSQTLEVKSALFKREKIKVNSKHTQLSPENLNRALAEKEKVNQIYTQVRSELFADYFTFPSPQRRTSVFGTKRVFNGEVKSIHLGIDFKSKIGDPIYAPSDGIVVLAENLFFSGHCLVIDHGRGIYSIFAHLSRYEVKPGDIVKRSQVIARSGNTGRSSGPHLHWGVVLQGVKVNPIEFIRLLGKAPE